VWQSLRGGRDQALRSWRQTRALAREAQELTKSDLPPDMREDVARSMLVIDRRARGRSLPNPIEILGYSVGYFREEDLRYLFHEIFVKGEYLFPTGNERPKIIDCGSNIGLSVLFFKRLYPQASIIAFEPDAETFSMLKRNVENNRLSDVVLHNCALSDREGEITFYKDAESSGSPLMSTCNERIIGTPTKVAATRLSPFVTGTIDLLKVDVEGAEHSLMTDLATTGRLALVRQIHLEYHHHIAGNTDRLSEMLRLLEDRGFGYQLRTASEKWPIPRSFWFSRWPAPCAFQDISIFAYRK
jgi:FkbM family methyltransferase